MTDHILFTFPAAKAFASGKIRICEMWVKRLADEWIATSSPMFATEWPGFHKFARGLFLMTFFTGSPATGWTRNFRLDDVELPWVYNFNRNIKMVLVMLYGIYFIKHFFIMSLLRQDPTTDMIMIVLTFRWSVTWSPTNIGRLWIM